MPLISFHVFGAQICNLSPSHEVILVSKVRYWCVKHCGILRVSPKGAAGLVKIHQVPSEPSEPGAKAAPVPVLLGRAQLFTGGTSGAMARESAFGIAADSHGPTVWAYTEIRVPWDAL